MAKKTNRELNCETCSNRMPDLEPELVPIFNCFVLCETQLMVGGMGGIYGINYLTVFEVAKMMGIELNLTFVRLLKAFELTLVKEMEKKTKKEIKKVEESSANRHRTRR